MQIVSPGRMPIAPHDARVRVGDRPPVVAADGEGGRPAGRAAGAVDVEDFVAPARRDSRRTAGCAACASRSSFFVTTGTLSSKSSSERELARVEAGLVPLAPVEGRVVVGVGADLASGAPGSPRRARRRPWSRAAGTSSGCPAGGTIALVVARREASTASIGSARPALGDELASACRRSPAAACPAA